jgi:outer membrane receptor for ferrienterochelin and colicin
VASELLIGQYTVAAELSGFKTQTRTGVRLRVADDYRIDFVLEPGDVTEVVTVAATSTPVKVLGGDVSGVITGQQVRELPLNGRNFLQLATLMPGVSAPDSLNMKDKGLLSGSDMSVSGGDVTGNLWTVDGANNNDVGSNRTILVYPSLDAIEEFKILRNSYGPEFGGAGGGQVNIVTRGGTNQFRGSGSWNFRNDALNATDYFLKEADQPKGELKRNDFGGSFGGPIIKDKLFFFGALEWNI